MKDLQELVRPNIWSLAPYSSARNEYAGREARVFLDANENPYNQPYNRYPDPLQLELKASISKVKGVPADCIFLGNGSDEAIASSVVLVRTTWWPSSLPTVCIRCVPTLTTWSTAQ